MGRANPAQLNPVHHSQLRSWFDEGLDNRQCRRRFYLQYKLAVSWDLVRQCREQYNKRTNFALPATWNLQLKTPPPTIQLDEPLLLLLHYWFKSNLGDRACLHGLRYLATTYCLTCPHHTARPANVSELECSTRSNCLGCPDQAQCLDCSICLKALLAMSRNHRPPPTLLAVGLKDVQLERRRWRGELDQLDLYLKPASSHDHGNH